MQIQYHPAILQALITSFINVPQQCGGLRGEREPADVRHDAADAQELPGLQVQQVSEVKSDPRGATRREG